MTDDGGLAFSVIVRLYSVASVLCTIVSEPNPLTPTSIPAQHEQSGHRPGPTRTCEQLEHPEGQGPLSEEMVLSLGASS